MKGTQGSEPGTTLHPPRRVYQKPPVIEALVDFRVTFPEPPPVPVLARLCEEEQERYPRREVLMTSALEYDPHKNAIVEASQNHNGYRILSDDSTRVAQFRRDGFAFSRLAPYDQWEAWKPEAERLWERYREACRPSHVTRTAVRYVNRVDIVPEPGRRIRDYIHVYPSVPEELPQPLNAFVMRLEMAITGLPEAKVILQVGRVEPPADGLVSILLDLDLFSTNAFESSDPSLVLLLEQLHETENQYFEACITDISRELFA